MNIVDLADENAARRNALRGVGGGGAADFENGRKRGAR
jgi:hypothetical protein